MKRMSKALPCLLLVALASSLLFVHGGRALGADSIKLGFVGALSTPFGASNKAVLEISVEELNQAGGILGKPVELVVSDWKRQVPLAVAAYKKLVMTDKCLAVFTEGTEGSTACSQVAARLFRDYPHLQFAFWTAHEGLTDVVAEEYDKYKFLFRPYASTGDTYDPNLGAWTMFTEMIGTKKLALVIEDIGWTVPYTKGLKGRHPDLKTFFESKGIDVVYFAKSAIDEKMFLPILEKCAQTGADTLYWITGYTDTVTLVKQWAQSAAKDLDLVTMSGAVSYAAFYKMTGGAALGVVSQWPEVKIPFTEKSLPFFEKLKAKKAGMLASTYGAYDGPWMIKAAVERAGDPQNIDAVIQALEEHDAQRGFWKWKFDKRHEPVKGYPYHPLIHAQFQGPDKYVVVHSEDIRKLANPNDHFIRVKELRKQLGQ